MKREQERTTMTSRRSSLFPVAVLLNVIVLLAYANCAVAAQRRPTVVVVAAKTSLIRARPSLEAAVVRSSARGAEFKLTASSEGWVKVSLAGGGKGWLPKEEVGIKVNRHGHVCVEIGLAKGLELGAIEGKFRGTGGSSGDSITLNAKGTLKLSICPEFEPCSVLRNQNETGQNMVLRSLRGVRQGPFIRLVPRLSFEPEVETEYVFDAYCLNFNKHNPSPSDQLALEGRAPGDIQRILNVKASDVPAVQLAVWALTDNVSREDAREIFHATDSDFNNATVVFQKAGLDPRQYRLFSPE
jgi:Bacterial SH3 domain